jgi:hypothetical protein
VTTRLTGSWWIAALAGVLPVLAANAAFYINVGAGMDGCVPYWEGCMSVSRGVRSGPGLALFKALSLPAALAMMLCWLQASRFLSEHIATSGRRGSALVWMGLGGALFYLVYAAWLGTEGEVYRWLRRYGVVFYFGLTGLAQLFMVSVLWPQRRSALQGRLVNQIRAFCWVSILAWATGVASAFKRKLIDDPAFLDRLENALEWDFALLLSLAFLALALVLRAAEPGRGSRAGASGRRRSNGRT